MGKQNHIIRKLVIEIGLPTQEEAFRIQNRLTDEYRRIILAIIEEILDRLVREEEIITVDRLEIDLGHVTAAHLSEEISRKVKQEMEEAVTNLLYELRSGSAGAAGIRMKTSRGDSITVQARRSHTAESSLETLAYFLEYGIFPWSEDRKKKPSLREMIGEALEKRPEELLRMLAQSVTKKHVFRRLALQLPEDQLCYLCAVLGCSFSAQLSQVFSGLEKIIRLLLREISRTGIQLPFPPEGSELHFRIREEALRYFASGEKWQGDLFLPGKVSDPVVKYFAVMFFSIIGKSALAVSKLPVPRSGNRPGGKSRKRNPVDGNFAKEISEALALFAPRGEKQTASKSRKKKKNAGRKAAPGAEEEKREVAAEEKSTPLQYAEEETPPAEVPAEDGIYVANSGLIILHP
ncbi:MAG TPA: contractile injection system tape measure protein, partial [Bacteroidia bacterium]|nr:contractile injection system tape measure protein [Bacteroidia bacterium]